MDEFIALHADEKPTKRKTMVIEDANVGLPQDTKRMRAQEVARKIKSLDHFCYVWGTKAGFYLPPRKCLTWHFVSQILAKEKLLLRLSDMEGLVDLPKVKGIIVDNVFAHYRDANQLEKYFPDRHASQRVPREYFYNVQLIRFCASSSRKRTRT